jgi:predicted nuclease of restriction endonuclease-like (RecB) superfamily
MTNESVNQGDGSRETSLDVVLHDVSSVIEEARRSAARSVNTCMTAAYWLIGRRIVEFDQSGEGRARYGEELLRRLSDDLSIRYGRGFSVRNLRHMRAFYLAWPRLEGQGFRQTPSAESSIAEVGGRFPLPWSSYVRLLSVDSKGARRFYEAEALRGGWSVRQLKRQIDSCFYERTALSRNKVAMLAKGQVPEPGGVLSSQEAIKDPFVLEFLDLKDEYSESDLEEALIGHLEALLLELGGDFCFIGRQKHLRVGDSWYRVDLLFFHRHLRCLVVIDLKIGALTAADAGQMHLYLNYARENWTRAGENPPVGLILCTEKNAAVAHYALEGLQNSILASEYRTTLPDEKELAAEIERKRTMLEDRSSTIA